MRNSAILILIVLCAAPGGFAGPGKEAKKSVVFTVPGLVLDEGEELFIPNGLRRDGPTDSKLTIRFKTRDFSATRREGDYKRASGRATFLPGEQYADFFLPVTTRRTQESYLDTHFIVELLPESNAGDYGLKMVSNLNDARDLMVHLGRIPCTENYSTVSFASAETTMTISDDTTRCVGTITLLRTGDLSQNVAILAKSRNGSAVGAKDYAEVCEHIEFPANVSSVELDISAKLSDFGLFWHVELDYLGGCCVPGAPHIITINIPEADLPKVLEPYCPPYK